MTLPKTHVIARVESPDAVLTIRYCPGADTMVFSMYTRHSPEAMTEVELPREYFLMALQHCVENNGKPTND